MLLNAALQSLTAKPLFGFNPTSCTEFFDRPASQQSLSCSVARDDNLVKTDTRRAVKGPKRDDNAKRIDELDP